MNTDMTQYSSSSDIIVTIIIIINTYMTQHSKKFKLSLQKHVFLIICSSLKHENKFKIPQQQKSYFFSSSGGGGAKTKKDHLKQKGQH